MYRYVRVPLCVRWWWTHIEIFSGDIFKRSPRINLSMLDDTINNSVILLMSEPNYRVYWCQEEEWLMMLLVSWFVSLCAQVRETEKKRENTHTQSHTQSHTHLQFDAHSISSMERTICSNSSKDNSPDSSTSTFFFIEKYIRRIRPDSSTSTLKAPETEIRHAAHLRPHTRVASGLIHKYLKVFIH